jgi:hypothetical protein
MLTKNQINRMRKPQCADRRGGCVELEGSRVELEGSSVEAGLAAPAAARVREC